MRRAPTTRRGHADDSNGPSRRGVSPLRPPWWRLLPAPLVVRTRRGAHSVYLCVHHPGAPASGSCHVWGVKSWAWIFDGVGGRRAHPALFRVAAPHGGACPSYASHLSPKNLNVRLWTWSPWAAGACGPSGGRLAHACEHGRHATHFGDSESTASGVTPAAHRRGHLRGPRGRRGSHGEGPGRPALAPWVLLEDMRPAFEKVPWLRPD